MTTCPHCGKKGVKIADRIWMGATEFVFDYCGYCGKNWPKHRTDKPDKAFDSNTGQVVDAEGFEANDN